MGKWKARVLRSEVKRTERLSAIIDQTFIRLNIHL